MEFDPEKFEAIRVSDLLADPRFDGNLRHLILTISERGGDATVAELAELVGIEPADLIARLVGEVCLAEFRRILGEDQQRGRANC